MPQPPKSESIKYKQDSSGGGYVPVDSEFDAEMRQRQKEAEGDAEPPEGDGEGYVTHEDPSSRLQEMANIPTQQEYDTPEQLQQAYEQLMGTEISHGQDALLEVLKGNATTESLEPGDRKLLELWLAPVVTEIEGRKKTQPDSRRGARVRIGFSENGKVYAVWFQDKREPYSEDKVVCLSDLQERGKFELLIGTDTTNILTIPSKAENVIGQHAKLTFRHHRDGFDMTVLDNSTNCTAVVERHKK